MDNNFIINVPRYLTSYEFYNNIVRQVNNIGESKKNIIVDFSETLKIEPLVVPNLLCMGQKIKLQTNKEALIYIPDTSTSGELKNYLFQVGFTKYAEKYDLYSFATSPYGGMEGKRIDPICGTLYFDNESTIDEIKRGVKNCILPFSERYLSEFEHIEVRDNDIYYINEIAEFLEEIITNCKIHARSFSFTTLHAKHSSKKIYISVSDLGIGFANTIWLNEKPLSEMDAILWGVYKRKESKVYGLYNIIRKVLNFSGKVRIHSNNTQIIFTQSIFKDFEKGNLKSNKAFFEFNVKKELPFDGVHIELELPLERGEKHVFF